MEVRFMSDLDIRVIENESRTIGGFIFKKHQALIVATFFFTFYFMR